jgi:hypothetical protein
VIELVTAPAPADALRLDVVDLEYGSHRECSTVMHFPAPDNVVIEVAHGFGPDYRHSLRFTEMASRTGCTTML